MKVLQVHTTINKGSIGHIVNDLGDQLLTGGHQSFIAFGRGAPGGASTLIRIGNHLHTGWHVIHTRLTDRHGFVSKKATERLMNYIRQIDPDLIQLHNLHGYYINIRMLAEYLQQSNKPVVWTLHDCWPFTGHCTYFDSVSCEKWKTGCFQCPKTRLYPSSKVLDSSKRNYLDKKALFAGLKKLHIVTPSQWLKEKVEQSFLQSNDCSVIRNGIDLRLFSPDKAAASTGLLGHISKKIILGVAFSLNRNKGLKDFIDLSHHISDDYVIVLVGLRPDLIRKMPARIIGTPRTSNREELASFYASANIFVNPTWQDNFPTTNLEALACGIPVITYETGGSPESVDKSTGRVVPKGDIKALWEAILDMGSKDCDGVRKACRERAERLFNKEERYLDYIRLYEQITKSRSSAEMN